MFDVYCPGHRADVLLDASRIEAIHNTARGPLVAWRCWCGARGALRAGTAAVRRHPGALAPTSGAA
jgi:hypothetical protein